MRRHRLLDSAQSRFIAGAAPAMVDHVSFASGGAAWRYENMAEAASEPGRNRADAYRQRRPSAIAVRVLAGCSRTSSVTSRRTLRLPSGGTIPLEKSTTRKATPNISITPIRTGRAPARRARAFSYFSARRGYAGRRGPADPARNRGCRRCRRMPPQAPPLSTASGGSQPSRSHRCRFPGRADPGVHDQSLGHRRDLVSRR